MAILQLKLLVLRSWPALFSNLPAVRVPTRLVLLAAESLPVVTKAGLPGRLCERAESEEHAFHGSQHQITSGYCGQQRRKLTGEVVYTDYPAYNGRDNPKKDQTTGAPKLDKAEAGILWSHKNKAVKWIAKISESGDVTVEKVLASAGGDAMETRYVGILPKGSNAHLTHTDENKQSKTCIISDDDAYDYLDRTAIKGSLQRR